MYRKTSVGENFCSFSFNHKCFLANHGVVDQQYKFVEMLQQTFLLQISSYFPLKMQKFSPMDVFPYTVYACMHRYIRIYVSDSVHLDSTAN